ncbi:MAG: hypothetical protein ACLVJ6_08795 [Merdibacter sp.]
MENALPGRTASCGRRTAAALAGRRKTVSAMWTARKETPSSPLFPSAALLQLQAQGVVDQDDMAKGKLFIYGHPITSFTPVLL